MSDAPTRPPTRSTPDVVERLYVLWIVSTLLLVLLIIVLSLFVSGRLRRQTEALSSLSESLQTLELRVAAVEDLRLIPDAPPASRPDRAAEEVPARNVEDEETNAGPRETSTAPTEAAATVLSDAQVNEALDRVLRRVEAGEPAVSDAAAAGAVLETALRDAVAARWSGATWARLAVLARLLNRHEAADSFARTAGAAGADLGEYAEVSVRVLLELRRAAEALPHADFLASQGPMPARTALLVAAVFVGNGRAADADRALDGVTEPASLPDLEKILLGRLLVAAERWPRLEALLATLDEVDDEFLSQRDYLHAVALIQRAEGPQAFVEALAILDDLLERRPEDYDVRIWRGVALLQARQFEAARLAFEGAARLVARPEAWYWQAVLEINSGHAENAGEHLQRALATSADFAPAWEALGTLAMNQGDVPGALQHLSNAIQANPRRASAHFLMAVASAKGLDREAAAKALAAAFELDGLWLEKAAQTEVIRRMFSDAELAELLGETPASQPAREPEPAPPGP